MTATRQLDAQLVADHGLTLSDYGVLLQLAWAPDRRMRRVDLAEQMLLTASGITRLLDGLERSGWVERASCDVDRRVVYAVLTETGLEKLRASSGSHVEQVESLFDARLDDDEQQALVGLLRKLCDEPASDCEPPDDL
jgi:DNA-binding MarR family transcriptional regulator